MQCRTRPRAVIRVSAVASFVGSRVGLAVAAVLMVRSTLGLGAWDAVVIGTSGQIPLSAGQASAALAALFVLAAWALGVRPTWGTVAASGLFSLAFGLLLPVIPPAPTPLVGAGYYLAALVLCGLATACYLAADCGRSAYDAFVTGLAHRTRQSPTRWRAGLEVAACGAAWVLGGPMGLGTVICTIAIAPSVALGLHAWPHCTRWAGRAAQSPGEIARASGRISRRLVLVPAQYTAAITARRQVVSARKAA